MGGYSLSQVLSESICWEEVNDSNFDESLLPLLSLISITASWKRVAWHNF